MPCKHSAEECCRAAGELAVLETPLSSALKPQSEGALCVFSAVVSALPHPHLLDRLAN